MLGYDLHLLIRRNVILPNRFLRIMQFPLIELYSLLMPLDFLTQMLNHFVSFSQHFDVVQPLLGLSLKRYNSPVSFLIHYLKLLGCRLDFANCLRVLSGFFLIVKVILSIRGLQADILFSKGFLFMAEIGQEFSLLLYDSLQLY
jgi:hypothetical protein